MADAAVDAIRPFVSRHIWAMIELQRFTGARHGEVIIMRTGDIDRTGPPWVDRPQAHKTEHHGLGRSIVLGPRGREVIEPYLKADPDAYLFNPKEVVAERMAARRASRKSKDFPSQRLRDSKTSDAHLGQRWSKNASKVAIWRDSIHFINTQ